MNEPQENPYLKPVLLGAAGVVIAGVIGSAAYHLGTTKIEVPAGNVAQVITNSSSVDLKIKGNRNSRIYHLPNCPNYGDISERNIVWFKTVEEAKSAGFRVAKNCP